MTETLPKILAIDDAPENLLALGAALADDYDLQIATSGEKGLKLARLSLPDLILLDVMMPDMDGYAACRQFKADPRLSAIPLIFVTGMAEPEAESAGLALGAADYITKPINVQIARQRIRNLLEREQLRKEVEAHRDRLEELVQQRTAELRNTNKRLSLAQHVAQSSEATIKQLMQQTLRVQENERARLSKELHDEIGQSLTALKLLLRRVQGNCREGAATDCLKEAAAATDDLMREVRSIAYRLRPSQLDELGLLPSLRWHLDKLVRPQGIAATLSGNINEQRLPADIELCCFRVAQEALTNVLRHARASACEVAVNRQGDELALLISDNGAGFAAAGQSDSPASSQTLGLVGMRERIAAVGGKLQINSTPGQGTKILAVFPLPESRS